MKKVAASRLIVRGKNNIIISGTGNFYNDKGTPDTVLLIEKVKHLEALLSEKERLIEVLMKNTSRNCK